VEERSDRDPDDPRRGEGDILPGRAVAPAKSEANGLMSTNTDLPDRGELARKQDGVDPEDVEALSELLERERIAAAGAAQSISQALLNGEQIETSDLSTLAESSDALRGLWHILCQRDEFQ
jgi:hypothetical protein